MRTLSNYDKQYIATLPKQVEDKIVFNGIKVFWLLNMMEEAKSKLKIGNEYTIKEIWPASSWTAVVLEEFPDVMFNYHWFS